MIYLLTIGWPWFAAALAIGLAAGWLFPAPNGEGSPRWMIWAALLLLAGAAAAFAQALPGRQGFALDVTWLASLAYFLGLPIGAAVRPEAPAPGKEPRRRPPVVLRGAPPLEPAREFEAAPAGAAAAAEHAPELIEAAEAALQIADAPLDAVAAPVSAQATEPEAQPEPATTEHIVQTPPAPAASTPPAAPEAAAQKPAKSKEQKQFPGARPIGLDAARGGTPDDLTKIKGLGPKSAEKLHSLGIYHIDQIAAWNLDNARWIGAALGVPGRVERSKWILQARDMGGGGKEGGKA